MLEYRILSAGDTGLVVEFGNRIERQLSIAVLTLASRLESAANAGIIETVPTFRSLLIQYDPLILAPAKLLKLVDECVGSLTIADAPGRTWKLPVCYEAPFAIDLEHIAHDLSLSPQTIIERHCAPIYHVYMLGFLPGQPYVGELPGELALDRLTTPRTRIPAGSVGIVGKMCSVFPRETPCGWHVIGRCPVRLWDPDRATALLAPGDKLTFVPVSAREYHALETNTAEPAVRLELPEPSLGAAA